MKILLQNGRVLDPASGLDKVCHLALAAGRRVSGKRKCAVVSGGNIDATVLSTLLSEVRPSPPRKPRRRNAERLRSRVVASTQRSSKSESPKFSVTAAVEETLW